ncbi:MAG: hypothetical protein WC966_01590 [Bradymonadales bacterium]|jgi:hypothetical protein
MEKPKQKAKAVVYQKPSIENLGKLSTLIRGNSGARRDMPPFPSPSPTKL